MPGTTFSVEIRPVLPERLARLDELANDLYFSWSRGVRRLFRHLDEQAWHASDHNPKVFLRQASQHRLEAAARDPVLFAEYRRVLSVYDTHLEERPHTQIDRYLDPENDLVVYFSAEFGFHQSMPIYAGGLGILAADYCKAMSNLWVPFAGVGLLYRQGYFIQRILADGEQRADIARSNPADLPVEPALAANGDEVRVTVSFPGRDVALRVWQARAGHIRLYLLDSDVPENSPPDRDITGQLYGGDQHTRIEQEIILGIGGVRALRALGLQPTVWHINEGHAAFQILERCRERCEQGLDLDSALEQVAANTLFTTHTPVPAGHDSFDDNLIRTYFDAFRTQLDVDEQRFLALGASRDTGFDMTALALRGSRFHNGVSRIHGEVAAAMESYIWPEIPPQENPMGHVTNGVDVETFLAASWVSMFDMYMGAGWRSKLIDQGFWNGFIDSIPDHVYLSARQVEKTDLLRYARDRVSLQSRRNGKPDTFVNRLTGQLSPQGHNQLIIGFARRFATYKRATLLFRDLPRLARLLNDPDRPVLILIAGKAHPRDLPGQQLLKEVFRVSMLPEFQGRVLLLEDYNLSMARELLPGIDIWVNMPEYPKEACGTSGMKAAINGGVNLSILDGWWGEASDGENGWAIRPHPELTPEERDQVEADELLDILEHQVIPLYFRHDDNGDPVEWIRKSKTSMKTVLPRFNTIRMALDYLREYYGPARDQGKRFSADDCAAARELAAWKAKVDRAWPAVYLRLSAAAPASVVHGEPVQIEVAVGLNGLDSGDVQVECLVGCETELAEFRPLIDLTLSSGERNAEGETLYRADLCQEPRFCQTGGVQHYKVRAFPCHPLLTHRFEHGHMRWLQL